MRWQNKKNRRRRRKRKRKRRSRGNRGRRRRRRERRRKEGGRRKNQVNPFTIKEERNRLEEKVSDFTSDGVLRILLLHPCRDDDRLEFPS